jgi:hypothetical protein
MQGTATTPLPLRPLAGQAPTVHLLLLEGIERAGVDLAAQRVRC